MMKARSQSWSTKKKKRRKMVRTKRMTKRKKRWMSLFLPLPFHLRQNLKVVGFQPEGGHYGQDHIEDLCQRARKKMRAMMKRKSKLVRKKRTQKTTNKMKV